MKRLLLTLLLTTSLSFAQAQMREYDTTAIDYEQSLVVSHPGIGTCDFIYEGGEFYVIHDDKTSKVQRCFVDKTLRGISSEKLMQFLVGGYLYINQLDNGEFTIIAKGRLNGGGFFVFLIAAYSVADLIMKTLPDSHPVSVVSNGSIATVTTARRTENVGPVRPGDPSRIGSSSPIKRRPDGPRQDWAPRPQDPPPTSRMPDRLDNTGTPRQPISGPNRPTITPLPPVNPMDNTK